MLATKRYKIAKCFVKPAVGKRGESLGCARPMRQYSHLSATVKRRLSVTIGLLVTAMSLSGCQSAVSLAADVIADNAANRQCRQARDDVERYNCEKKAAEQAEKYNFDAPF